MIEEFVNGLGRDHSIVTDSNKAAAARLVWFVAIAGFAFISMPRYAEMVG